MLEQARREADGVLFLDAGDALTGPQVLTAQKAARAGFILDCYRSFGLDAMGLGEKDRDAGVDLAEVREGALVMRAGVRFGVFSADLEAHPDTRLEALGAQAASLRKRGADLVVALLHGGLQVVKGVLAPGGAGIDVAVVSHSPWAAARPERAGSTWLVETPPQGKMAGLLDLHILDGKLDFVDIGGAADARQRIREVEQELAGVAERFKDASGSMVTYRDKRRAELEAQRARWRDTLVREEAGKPISGSWLENRLVALGTDIADSPAVADKLRKYKEKVGATTPAPRLPSTGLAGPVTTTGTAALPGGTTTGGFTQAAGTYVGINVCRQCHEPQYQFWRTSKHARAWDALKAKEQFRDPACVGCHVTAHSTALPDVQCEACHGPGGAHSANKDAKGLILRSPTEGVCTTCHHAPEAKEWDFTTFRAAIVGPTHGAPRPAVVH